MRKTTVIGLRGCLAGFLLLIILADAHAGDFVLTCVNVYIHNIYEKTELYASCKNMAGVYKDTSINLDQLIGNNHGKLVWNDGTGYVYFSRTCGAMSLSGDYKILYASCQKYVDGRSVLEDTSIDLNAKISNHNGVLQKDSRY